MEGGNDSMRSVGGTTAFLPPEALDGEAYSGKSADVWALGCTLFMMLYGDRPFHGDT
jgi:serine/threonine protein kinase